MSNPQKEEALRLYAMGDMTHQEVAARVNRAPSTVSGWLRRKKIEDGAWTNKDNKFRGTPPPPPRDTRTPAQRLMGEPPFERSALYQKMQGGA